MGLQVIGPEARRQKLHSSEWLQGVGGLVSGSLPSRTVDTYAHSWPSELQRRSDVNLTLWQGLRQRHPFIHVTALTAHKGETEADKTPYWPAACFKGKA